MKKALSEYSTSELVEELKTRQGVQTQWAEPKEDIHIDENSPAIVIIVTD